MSKYRDRTEMGGENEVFRTTRWVDIQALRTVDEARRRLILDGLLKAYWKPVYCYLRRKGQSNEMAKDLTQGFFHEIVLGRNIIAQADREKGRFRTFLLTALDNYAANVYHKQHARKRRPDGELFSFSAFDAGSGPDIPDRISPDEAFHYTWASQLLDEVLARVKNDCCRTGKEVHWNVFQDRIVGPILENTETVGLTEICARHGVESEARASNMIVTVKRRFNAVLKQCLRKHVESDEEVEDELNELLRILSRGRAR